MSSTCSRTCCDAPPTTRSAPASAAPTSRPWSSGSTPASRSPPATLVPARAAARPDRPAARPRQADVAARHGRRRVPGRGRRGRRVRARGALPVAAHLQGHRRARGRSTASERSVPLRGVRRRARPARRALRRQPALDELGDRVLRRRASRRRAARPAAPRHAGRPRPRRPAPARPPPGGPSCASAAGPTARSRRSAACSTPRSGRSARRCSRTRATTRASGRRCSTRCPTETARAVRELAEYDWQSPAAAADLRADPRPAPPRGARQPLRRHEAGAGERDPGGPAPGRGHDGRAERDARRGRARRDDAGALRRVHGGLRRLLPRRPADPRRAGRLPRPAHGRRVPHDGVALAGAARRAGRARRRACSTTSTCQLGDEPPHRGPAGPPPRPAVEQPGRPVRRPAPGPGRRDDRAAGARRPRGAPVRALGPGLPGRAARRRGRGGSAPSAGPRRRRRPADPAPTSRASSRSRAGSTARAGGSSSPRRRSGGSGRPPCAGCSPPSNARRGGRARGALGRRRRRAHRLEPAVALRRRAAARRRPHVTNAVRRAGPVRAGAARCASSVEDFEVSETERRSTAAVSVLLDMSYSMVLRDTWTAAKSTALALHALVTGMYPHDAVQLIGFSRYAQEIAPDRPADPRAGHGAGHEPAARPAAGRAVPRAAPRQRRRSSSSSPTASRPPT